MGGKEKIEGGIILYIHRVLESNLVPSRFTEQDKSWDHCSEQRHSLRM